MQRPFAICVLSCLGASFGWADDVPKPPAKQDSSQVEERPFDAAKKQFQASERQRTAPSAQGFKEELPELQSAQSLSGNPVANLINNNKLVDQKHKARDNWLIRGMQKPDEKGKKRPSATTLAQESRTEDEKNGDDDIDVLGSTLQGAPLAKSELKRLTPLPKPEVDPLLPFMGKWMSNRDYELLVKPKLGSSSPEGITTTKDGSSEFPMLPAGDSDRGGSQRNAPGGALAAENPFLKSLGEGLSSQPSPSSGQSGQHQTYPVVSDTIKKQSEPADKTPPKDLRSQLMQSDDRKYFPQLKRF